MKSLKELIRIKKGVKYNALFKDITPMEYVLICIPFTISMISSKSISASTFGFTFTALLFMMGLGILFLLGFRWRILYFVILLFFADFLIISIGKPLEYWLMADRDAAIRVGIEAILQGQNPYKAITNLGHTPTPLPFTFILYLPIYLITFGHTFFMNLIIMTLFCILLFHNYADTDKDYLILPIISFIIFSDYFFLEIGMNSDVINVSLILCMILFLIPDYIPKQKKFKKKIFRHISIVPEEPKKIDKKIIRFAILFGCILAMRVYIWLIGIIIALYILRIYGLKNTIRLGLITISVFLIWMLPFMLLDLDYFINVCPIAHNSNKFNAWRSYNSVQFPGEFVLLFLNTFFIFGKWNGIIISIFIITCSLLLGLIKCDNKFHLLFIISFCFLLFLFFYLFCPYYVIMRDYVSIASVPFVFSFLYIDYERYTEVERKKEEYMTINTTEGWEVKQSKEKQTHFIINNNIAESQDR